MKKQIYSCIFLIGCVATAHSQVGINTQAPASTLEIVAKNPTGTSTDVDGLIIPKVDRQRAQSMTGVPSSTLIYVDDISTGTQTGAAVNINAVGLYIFIGTSWSKVTPATNNIYTNDGALTANRSVIQLANTLSFTSTAADGFSVGNLTRKTFSVNGANGRVGIGGVTAPSSILDVRNTTAGGTTDAFSAGINNCGSPCAQGTARNVVLYNANNTNSQFAGLYFVPSITSSDVAGASILGIDRDATNGYAGIQFTTKNATTDAPRMTIKSSGNIGIGTTAPTNALHVSASADPLRLSGLQASSAVSGTLVVNSTGVVQLSNASSKSAVRATGNITITTNNTSTNTGAATEAFDNRNEFTGNTFTAADAGLYKVDFTINYTQRSASEDGGDGYLGYASMTLNGVAYSGVNTKVTLSESTGAPSYNTCTNSSLVKMAAGDVLAFQGLTFGSTPATTNIVAPFTINIVRVD